MPWDPAQYLKFADHRLRPAMDLLNRINLEAPRRVVDLGAGAGNVTRLLKQRWPEASITGIDSSEEMVEQARTKEPGIEWQVGDIGSWQADEPVDLVYSNAALHWIEGHESLFPRLMESVAPGGVLAVQMPRNFGAKSHTSISEAALAGPWRSTLEPLLRPAPVAEPEAYIDLLSAHAASLDVWETSYQQILTGENPVKEWTKGTWLRPLLDALEEPQRTQFESAYAELVRQHYPARPNGTTVFPFRRLFIVAIR